MRSTFAKTLLEITHLNPDTYVMTGDLGFSVFEDYIQEFPDQFLNVGVCEQAMIGIASGMAMEGRDVYCYSIAPFVTFRVLEQVRNDLCYQGLPVKIIGVGAGVSYGALGGTHHALEDVAVMRALPNMLVFAPGDPLEVEQIIRAAPDFNRPCYIRLSKGEMAPVHTPESIANFKIGSPLLVCGNPGRLAVFASGGALSIGLETHNLLQQQGAESALYSVHSLAMVDEACFVSIIQKNRNILLLEEHYCVGGLQQILADIIMRYNLDCNVVPINFPHVFPDKIGSQTYLHRFAGISAQQAIRLLTEAGVFDNT